jgi:ParB family chromosome partitioning protein
MRLEEIPLNRIFVSESNVRKRQVQTGIDELAENIRRHGLLHPVVVFPKDDKFELIVGQRRFYAFQKLNKETIPAIVLGSMDENKARILSLSEGIHRVELPPGDLMDAIEALYKKYGTAKLIAEELGMKEAKVREWIPISLAPEPVKEMLKERKIRPSDVKKAMRAGGNDNQKIVEIAREMPKMTASEKNRLVDFAVEKPEVPVKDLIDQSKKPYVEEKVIVHLTPKWADKLDTAAKDLGLDREDVAKTAVIDWLSSRGYG